MLRAVRSAVAPFAAYWRARSAARQAHAFDARYGTDTVARVPVAQMRDIPAALAAHAVHYEPSTLQGRRSISPDRDETTVRLGLALTYVARRNWAITATADFDDVSSDDVSRGMDRTRYGVSARYQF